MPLTDTESIKEVRIAKDIDLSHLRDPMHIKRHFTNATHLVNASNLV